MKARPPLVVGLVLLLGGVGLSFGAYASYRDEHSGTPGTARVISCSGHNGRYGTGVVCDGTWVSGGSVLAGGHVAFGQIKNASRDDIGHTVAVRIHGSDHATIPSSTVWIVLAAIGLPMLGLGVYLLALTRRSRSSRASTSGSAAS